MIPSAWNSTGRTGPADGLFQSFRTSPSMSSAIAAKHPDGRAGLATRDARWSRLSCRAGAPGSACAGTGSADPAGDVTSSTEIVRVLHSSSFRTDAPSAITTLAPASSIWYRSFLSGQGRIDRGYRGPEPAEAANMLVISSTRFASMTASQPPRRSPAFASRAATADTVWVKTALSSSWRSSRRCRPPRDPLWPVHRECQLRPWHTPPCRPGLVLSRRYGRRNLLDIERRVADDR